MDRNLALEFVRVTEAAAISSAVYMGRGDNDAADQAAVDAMRRTLETVDVDGRVAIGEGERDEAPMLYIGEEFGIRAKDSPKIDVALDPLEGTTICALGHYDALSVIAIAERGNFLHAPDTYMFKIAVGPDCKGKIKYEMSTREKLQAVADIKSKALSAVTAVVLDRDRHKTLIAEIREVGCRIRLIGDGDVSAAISTCNPETGTDILLGAGGAPEGVIAAAAIRCLGGDFIGKLQWRNDDEKDRALKMGVADLDKVYSITELAKGDVMFAATGVTDGAWLRGVKYLAGGKIRTHSIVMRSLSGTTREIKATHNLERKPTF